MNSVDYDVIAERYDMGRALPPDALDGWRVALSQHLAKTSALILDLGSGTGLWSVLLADWFDADVIGVEPSHGMLCRASAERMHPRIHYVRGEAERIPLANASCSHAWLSTVVHHVRDLGACVRALRRVLKPDGRVLIRSAFKDRTDGIAWLRFFPAARPLAESRWPAVEDTTSAFAAAGFSHASLASVTEISASNPAEYCERIEARADSMLSMIPDDDFEQPWRQ